MSGRVLVVDDEKTAREELCEAIRRFSLDQYGLMAKCVFNNWGVTSTSDFGEIVFNLIGADLLQKTADDRREDFHGLFTFEDAFDGAFSEELQEVEIDRAG